MRNKLLVAGRVSALRRAAQAGGLLGVLALAGCVLPLPSYVQPIGPQDRMPNGTVEQVRRRPSAAPAPTSWPLCNAP